jgi:cleavage and polyadenylation specificity factor subunit 2
MITFTPLSGAAHSSRIVPLAYLLQVDDIRILLDCGSPDWNPESIETTQSESGDELIYPWEEYCDTLKK